MLLKWTDTNSKTFPNTSRCSNISFCHPEKNIISRLFLFSLNSNFIKNEPPEKQHSDTAILLPRNYVTTKSKEKMI